MKRFLTRSRWLFATVLGVACGPCTGLQAAPRHAISGTETLVGGVDEARGEVVIRFRGRALLAYAWAPTQWKPYVRELYTLRGENLLLDAPSDHLHHHGLMFAIRVNGVNFWEEKPPAGRQVTVRPPTLVLGRTSEGLPQAVLEHSLRWQPADVEAAAAALLLERRTLVITVDPGLEEVALEWRSDFTVGPGAARVELHGSDYNGLGLRLPPELDHVAEFQNSAGLAYSEAQTSDVRAARWTAVSGQVGGRPVHLALAAHPDNLGESLFFTMRNAFAYLAATPGLGRQPIQREAGKDFSLRYRLVAYPETQNTAFLGERLGDWRPTRK